MKAVLIVAVVCLTWVVSEAKKKDERECEGNKLVLTFCVYNKDPKVV